MSLENALRQVGLSDKQAKVYLSALEHGESSITELAKVSHLKRATAHLIIEELEMRGLLSGTKQGKRRKFSAVHPRRLLQMASNTQKQIEEALPQLVAIHNEQKEKPKIQVFEGREGMALVYKEIYSLMSNRKELLGFTRLDTLWDAPGAVDEYKKVLRKVKNPKVRELNYDNEAGRKWAEQIGALKGKYHQIRLLPDDFEYGTTDNLIIDNTLVIFSVKKNIFVILIESEEIVKTYKALFEWAWKQGKEV